MGINTMDGREKQDKKYDDKKSSSSPTDKVVEDTKNKVRDIHKKKGLGVRAKQSALTFYFLKSFDKSIQIIYNRKVNMFYFLKNIIMDKKTLTTIVATAVISSTTPTNADTLKDNDINKIVCTTKQSCEKLSNSIQTQINELESKGEENLTDNEIDRYLSLQKSLIAVENQKQIIEDKKHLVQNKLIAEENNKQETQDKIHQNQEILKKVNQEQIKEQLTSIKGSFL